MTTSIEFDAVSNFSDEHATVGEHPISAGVQVAQAASGQAAQSGEPVPVDVGSGAPAQGADNAQNAQGADKPAADANAPAGNAPAANAAASNVPHEYHAEAGNVVKLPANVSIDNIKVDGHNLVLVQPDGSEIVIKDGALNVPTFIIGDVEVPRVALIAALESSHVDVAFGADGSISAGGNGAPGSAGGNFSVPPGGIGDGFGLTSLLPPTALQFGQPENRELFPSVVDRGISVVAVSLLSPDEAASETGLNGGQGQSPGSDAPSNAETSSIGTISIDAPDGIGSIVINGVTVTGTGQQIQGQFGYLTIVSFDPNTGAIEYNYTVTESVTHPKQTDGFDQTDTVPDNFSITVTDSDGDTASTTFAVAIIDDVPTAIADVDSVAAGQLGPATGNVLVGGTDAGDANATDGVADTQGADGATVVGVAKGTTNADLDDASTLNTAIQGAYGKLTLHADGSYTYVRDANTPGGVNDVFTYTIKDGDGDTSHTTLTISIGNSTPEISDLTPEANGGDVVVNEAALNVGTPGGPGSDPASTAETGTGSFTISSPDGVASLTIDGHDFITNGVFSAGSFTTALGNTLTVTGYNAATGVVSYTYTLLDNETHATGAGTNSLFENMTVSLTDQDGQNATGTLSVNIVDDVPTATNDGPYTVVEDGAGAANTPPTSTVSGDVLANDASGADTP
ncbi:VCBS repeat-containing protein, partial [Mesorhizobium shonense]